MAYFEAWIANCQLGHVERNGMYRCQASIWADGHDRAVRQLAAHLDSQGYRILWMDVCEPAQAHDGDAADSIPLAHAANPLVLGPILSTDDEKAPETYLIVEELDDVAPLDAQFGVWPLKKVPDALDAPLFGQPVPTEAEVAHYGGNDAVPPMKTYAILDASKIMGLAELLENHELEHRCLFKGKAARTYRNVAPYLVDLDKDNPFVRSLFTYLPDQPRDMATLHSWHREPGIYMRSRFGFEHLWKHFRKFTRLYSKESDTWRYFRFYEPSVVGSMIAQFTPEAYEKFGAVVHAFTGWTADRKAVHITRRYGNEPLAPLETGEEELF